MADAQQQETEKGDDVLRRLLKTPPDPKTGKGEKDNADDARKDRYLDRNSTRRPDPHSR